MQNLLLIGLDTFQSTSEAFRDEIRVLKPNSIAGLRLLLKYLIPFKVMLMLVLLHLIVHIFIWRGMRGY